MLKQGLAPGHFRYHLNDGRSCRDAGMCFGPPLVASELEGLPELLNDCVTCTFLFFSPEGRGTAANRRFSMAQQNRTRNRVHLSWHDSAALNGGQQRIEPFLFRQQRG